MDSLELENLRAIQKSGELHLNNLNLFLGANSTGKSTILRFFPLIRQTLSRNNNSPLLWYDSEGVDFGSFKESVYLGDISNEISFKFGFKNMDIDLSSSDILLESLHFYLRKNNNNVRPGMFFFGAFNSNRKENILTKVSAKVSINQDNYTMITIFYNSKSIEFDLVKSIVKINNRRVDIEADIKLIARNESHKIIPELWIERKEQHKNIFLGQKIAELLVSNIFEQIDSRISIDTLENFLKSLKYFETKEDFKINALTNVTQKSIKKYFNKNIDSIYDYFTIVNALYTIDQINYQLSDVFTNISYIAPVRATAERYYRIQGLSVLDVDSMGSNVPMILHSMTPSDKRAWMKWTKENFDIEFETFKNTGHTGITVKNPSGNKHNLADTGFGYSQILPVLLVVWKQISKATETNSNYNYKYAKRNIQKKPLIIIEQPELHLHPAMQSQIADLLIKIISMQPNIKFIIETHSVVIMNRIGQHIEKENTSDRRNNLENKINIFLVNPSDNLNKNVTITSYNEEGIIEKWPIGFLSGGIL